MLSERTHPAQLSPTVHHRANSQRASDVSAPLRTPSLGEKYGYTSPATVTHTDCFITVEFSQVQPRHQIPEKKTKKGRKSQGVSQKQVIFQTPDLITEVRLEVIREFREGLTRS